MSSHPLSIGTRPTVAIPAGKKVQNSKQYHQLLHAEYLDTVVTLAFKPLCMHRWVTVSKAPVCSRDIIMASSLASLHCRWSTRMCTDALWWYSIFRSLPKARGHMRSHDQIIGHLQAVRNPCRFQHNCIAITHWTPTARDNTKRYLGGNSNQLTDIGRKLARLFWSVLHWLCYSAYIHVLSLINPKVIRMKD